MERKKSFQYNSRLRSSFIKGPWSEATGEKMVITLICAHDVQKMLRTRSFPLITNGQYSKDFRRIYCITVLKNFAKINGEFFFNRIACPQPADVLKTNFLRIVFLWIRQNFYEQLFFSISIFFHRHWQFTGQQRKGGGHLLFHSTTSTCSQTLRSLFATLQVRWLSCTFNRTACIYQTSEIYHLYLIELSFDWLMMQC